MFSKQNLKHLPHFDIEKKSVKKHKQKHWQAIKQEPSLKVSKSEIKYLRATSTCMR